jgi:putative transposase
MGSAYHQLYFHYVWGTYKRIEMINTNIELELRKSFEDKIVEKKSEMICFGCTNDHVHLLLRQHPGVSVSEMIGEVKGYSSFVINNQIHPGCGFRWQRGFGAVTVSRKSLPRLIRYVENQKDHHGNNDLHMDWEIKNK